jgi:type IV fimbrial biogenesis protein FimT
MPRRRARTRPPRPADACRGAPVRVARPRPAAPPALHRLRGFTLVELAIVLALAALLLRLAVPGLSHTVATRALVAQSAEFMSALRFARSEAIKRGGAVTLCAATPPAAQSPACQSGRAVDWRWGWIVFADAGRRGELEVGEPVLRIQQPLAHTGGVAGTRAALSFTAAGFSTDAASHFLFNPSPQVADAPPAVLVCVSKQGRPRQAPGAVCL